MSHLTTELCEKYPGEPIQQWEYELEAKEWAAVGFFPTALAERTRHRLPKGCFFSQTGTKDDVLKAWDRIKFRLARKVKLECTIGVSFGKDLEPVSPPPPLPLQIHAPELRQDVHVENPHSPDDTLSSAFNKLFGPPTL